MYKYSQTNYLKSLTDPQRLAGAGVGFTGGYGLGRALFGTERGSIAGGLGGSLLGHYFAPKLFSLLKEHFPSLYHRGKEIVTNPVKEERERVYKPTTIERLSERYKGKKIESLGDELQKRIKEHRTKMKDPEYSKLTSTRMKYKFEPGYKEKRLQQEMGKGSIKEHRSLSERYVNPYVKEIGKHFANPLRPYTGHIQI